MKSPSSNENEAKINTLDNETMQSVNDALDHSVDNLPESTLSDIARVRAIALRQSKVQTRSNQSAVDTLLAWFLNPMVKVGLPLAVAVVIVISVKFVSVETIPELPLAMMTTEIPNEDFAMLEDLEFVTWLAENEQSALL